MHDGKHLLLIRLRGFVCWRKWKCVGREGTYFETTTSNVFYPFYFIHSLTALVSVIRFYVISDNQNPGTCQSDNEDLESDNHEIASKK